MPSPLIDIIREDARRVAQMVDLSPLSGKRVIVTGATGLIGTYLTAALEEGVNQGADIKVVMVARKFTGPTEEIGRRFSRYEEDLTVAQDVAHLPIADVIFHAAGYGQPAKFMADGLSTVRLNTAVTASLVGGHLAEDGTMLYASSSEVYSGSTALPYAEDAIGTTTPQHPRACYIEAKRCGEAICSYADNELRKKGGRCVSARIALAYGPGTKQGDSRVINEFIHSAIVNGGITLRDAGLAYRTYCYVSDTVEMLLDVALYGKQAVYNVGGTSGTNVRALAIMIGRMTGTEVTIPPEALGDTTLSSAPEKVEMDISRIRRETNKAHFVPLEEGLARTIRYQKLLYA